MRFVHYIAYDLIRVSTFGILRVTCVAIDHRPNSQDGVLQALLVRVHDEAISCTVRSIALQIA
jgi:hypothetical protein